MLQSFLTHDRNRNFFEKNTKEHDNISDRIDGSDRRVEYRNTLGYDKFLMQTDYPRFEPSQFFASRCGLTSNKRSGLDENAIWIPYSDLTPENNGKQLLQNFMNAIFYGPQMGKFTDQIGISTGKLSYGGGGKTKYAVTNLHGCDLNETYLKWGRELKDLSQDLASDKDMRSLLKPYDRTAWNDPKLIDDYARTEKLERNLLPGLATVVPYHQGGVRLDQLTPFAQALAERTKEGAPDSALMRAMPKFRSLFDAYLAFVPKQPIEISSAVEARLEERKEKEHVLYYENGLGDAIIFNHSIIR
jgi:hypothetical protein